MHSYSQFLIQKQFCSICIVLLTVNLTNFNENYVLFFFYIFESFTLLYALQKHNEANNTCTMN